MVIDERRKEGKRNREEGGVREERVVGARKQEGRGTLGSVRAAVLEIAPFYCVHKTHRSRDPWREGADPDEENVRWWWVCAACLDGVTECVCQWRLLFAAPNYRSFLFHYILFLRTLCVVSKLLFTVLCIFRFISFLFFHKLFFLISSIFIYF